MKIGVAEPMLTQKKIKVSMGQRCPYSTKWVLKVVVILHIYGARAIFLLFCNNQDTESGSQEIEIDRS